MVIVAFYGRKGSFSEEGALKFAKNLRGVRYLECGKSIEEVFLAVNEGKADYGVVPVENSNHGIITKVYDLLLKRKGYIVGEVVLPIIQCLLAKTGATFDSLKKIYTHPAALSQCERFLRTYPKWEIDTTYGDTATCARLVAESKSVEIGAIGNKRAAEVYGLKVLQDNIQTGEKNFTRFFALCMKPLKGEKNKTSIAFKLRDGLNSLYWCISEFVKNDIKIVHISTRPSEEPFEYVIYLDYLGGPKDPKVKEAERTLFRLGRDITILGEYLAAPMPPF